jgi:hypothetical protein
MKDSSLKWWLTMRNHSHFYFAAERQNLPHSEGATDENFMTFGELTVKVLTVIGGGYDAARSFSDLPFRI